MLADVAAAIRWNFRAIDTCAGVSTKGSDPGRGNSSGVFLIEHLYRFADVALHAAVERLVTERPAARHAIEACDLRTKLKAMV
jgi:hypothetical protein